MSIKSLTIVTAVGVKTFELTGMVGEKQIAAIAKEPLYITGDPYDHYIGRDDDGDMIFSVNCLAPCEIEYS